VPSVRAPVRAPSPPPPAPEPPAAGGDDRPAPVVRDHRGEGPSAPPSPIIPATTIAYRKAVDAAILACGQAVWRPAEGAPRAWLHVTLRVASGNVSASNASVTGADALGPDYAECVRRVAEGYTGEPPAGQTDGEDTVHIPVRVH